MHNAHKQLNPSESKLTVCLFQGVEPVLRTYNTLIIACNMCNQPREAMAVHRRMLNEGYMPNATTYNALISAYGKAGQLDKVMEVSTLFHFAPVQMDGAAIDLGLTDLIDQVWCTQGPNAQSHVHACTHAWPPLRFCDLFVTFSNCEMMEWNLTDQKDHK